MGFLFAGLMIAIVKGYCKEDAIELSWGSEKVNNNGFLVTLTLLKLSNELKKILFKKAWWLKFFNSKKYRCFLTNWLLFYTVYREMFAPVFFLPFRPHCQKANLRLDESQCLILFLLTQNCDWANLKLGETSCKCRWVKIHEAKIPLYTVVKKNNL